ncbi:hypothetical protein F1559_004159 [Cyanidiococcus yangmingshanensis]|uniref:Uncharacterized protein n=1 Tax=Cyanidiococcus yangmingshanensis TaxID=2690220 RepID=A0A7J7IGT6_9RHOD|nr:hypothetical protein F1559_004159 [Cyanidiococcus yangmingshanensis]
MTTFAKTLYPKPVSQSLVRVGDSTRDDDVARTYCSWFLSLPTSLAQSIRDVAQGRGLNVQRSRVLHPCTRGLCRASVQASAPETLCSASWCNCLQRQALVSLGSSHCWSMDHGRAGLRRYRGGSIRDGVMLAQRSPQQYVSGRLSDRYGHLDTCTAASGCGAR